MFKCVVQLGRNKRKAEAYAMCYVEALSEERATLAACFNILAGRSNHSGLAL
jgi:hypothetical protein